MKKVSSGKVYRMNFHNRVMRASSKNFQLIKATDENVVPNSPNTTGKP
jgi:hypothetical protein